MTIDILQTSNKQTDYDIVVVGAGTVGLTLVCGLFNQGLRIAVLDAQKETNVSSMFAVDRAGYGMGNRVSAITQGSQRILENYQVWQKIDKNLLSPFESMEIWEEGSDLCLTFDAAELGQPCLGSILCNQTLTSALLTQCKTANNVHWYFTESLNAIQNDQQPVILSLASGQSITTQLVVGADGSQSYVRQLAKIPCNERFYQQDALVVTVQTALAHQKIARQIFLPNGPLAFLPLTNSNLSSIVWSTTCEEAKRLKTLSEIDFNQELTRAFERRLGNIEWSSERLSFPLKTQHSERYIKPGIVLIGDAVHTVHPLAGQGTNLGIADAWCLANLIIAAHQKQRPLGALYTLRPYERERRFYRRLMGMGIEVIKQSFDLKLKNSFSTKIRQIGLKTLEKNVCLKNYFMRFAMDVSRLGLKS